MKKKNMKSSKKIEFRGSDNEIFKNYQTEVKMIRKLNKPKDLHTLNKESRKPL